MAGYVMKFTQNAEKKGDQKDDQANEPSGWL
jgi:hypothetical protein